MGCVANHCSFAVTETEDITEKITFFKCFFPKYYLYCSFGVNNIDKISIPLEIITNIQKERIFKYYTKQKPLHLSRENEINLSLGLLSYCDAFYCEGQAYELPVRRLLFVADLMQPAGRAG